jgi:pimeloyl-ACP methyl ester carboxylesterase
MGKFIKLFYQFVIKEYHSFIRHVWYRLSFWNKSYRELKKEPHPFFVGHSKEKTAKVVILIHAMKAHPSSFIPLVDELKKQGIHNIWAIHHKSYKDNPIPVDQLNAVIEKIKEIYKKKGYSKLQIALVGHSLGAIIASKYTFKEMGSASHPISLVISLAGRLRFIPNSFLWFYENLKDEIQDIHKAYKTNGNNVQLCTIWGDQDEIVPMESAHIHDIHQNRLTVEGWGHEGIIFAPEAKIQVAQWTKEWKEI